ncbi:hypothetical protein GS399_15425 [Pedobacter sp. HMF7647]|uniref:Uncharacterized protein n=1 Tax=Hufsiella arboris TaxID=2695275 RepID=A0A7K1YCQ5_9SPHI|nr:hypothetical protein [Hufsiella arboris]MXV52364.1 hypothetical protein [Hufsiella arboris]
MSFKYRTIGCMTMKQCFYMGFRRSHGEVCLRINDGKILCRDKKTLCWNASIHFGDKRTLFEDAGILFGNAGTSFRDARTLHRDANILSQDARTLHRDAEILFQDTRTLYENANFQYTTTNFYRARILSHKAKTSSYSARKNTKYL